MAVKKALSPEEARENGRKGGLASGESRRRSKTFRDVFKALMRDSIGSHNMEGFPEYLAGKYDITMQEAIAITIAYKAVLGNLDAAEFIRDTMGEKPTDKVDMSADSDINVKIQVIR